MKTALNLKQFFSFLILIITASPTLASQRDRALSLLNEAYSPYFKVVKTTKNITLLGCRNSTVQIQSPDPIIKQLRHVELSVFKPVRHEAREAILIVPPTGGENTLDRGYAYLLCQDGFEVVIVSSWDQLDAVNSNLKSQDIALIRAVTAIRNAVDYVKKPTGILATSMGAIFTAATLAVEPRFKAAFLIVGGAPISEILATSDHKKVRRVRESRMKAHHYRTAGQYQRALKEAMEIDLDSLIQPIPDLHLKMVIATADSTVPTKNQFLLWEGLGRPESLRLARGHGQTVIQTYARHSREVVEFFDRTLRGDLD